MQVQMHIGPSVVIKGNISSSEDLAIAGRVEGDIQLHAGALMLGPGSQVVGDIAVPSVVVHGRVQGRVAASSRVEVRPGASVVGSLAATTLVVADGAQMNCRVEMPAIARSQVVPPAIPVPPKLPAV